MSATTSAATRPRRRRRRAPVLAPEARHLVSRFTGGTTPRLVAQVRRAGAGAWYERQLVPHRIADPAGADLDTWWPQLRLSPGQLWQRHVDGTQEGWELMRDYSSWVLTRRMYSERQVLEVMVAFWENHLHIPHNADAWPYRPSYGRTIRAHALGRYDDMLVAAVTHPAMLAWLNAIQSTKTAPNENLARELLELFTVGLGSFGEQDVKDAALLLTGYHADVFRTWDVAYRADRHHVGPVRVLDFAHPNAAADGRPATEAMLRYLARHPATAHHLARKLAVKFVCDDPPPALVRRLAATYLANDTRIAPVLRTLVRSPEFARFPGAKLRDPVEDLVATYRALQIRFRRPTATLTATEAIVWQTGRLGLRVGDWPRPDGAPLDNAAWATTLRALGSAELHHVVGHGWWPDADVGAVHRPARAWVPWLPIRFDVLVDHVSRQLLGRPASAGMVDAACLALSLRPGEAVRAGHPLLEWRMGDLLTVVLDSPSHYHR